MASDAKDQWIEHLENEFRKSQEEIVKLQQQYHEVRAELETCKDIKELLARKRIFAQILSMKNAELVTLRHNQEQLVGAIDKFRDIFRQQHKESHAKVIKWRENLDQAAEQIGVPDFAKVIVLVIIP